MRSCKSSLNSAFLNIRKKIFISGLDLGDVTISPVSRFWQTSWTRDQKHLGAVKADLSLNTFSKAFSGKRGYLSPLKAQAVFLNGIPLRDAS